ncbi:hypothetical protein DMC47_16790 [Nostoc sp. 3335mG]|nr:hypothetical protein DMC47_16790 [Nostoc sp. 3335mG]
MSDNPVDMRDGHAMRVERLLADAAASEPCADRALTAATDDFFLPEDQRLGEQVRSAMAVLLRGLIELIEAQIRDHAVRLLAERGEAEAGRALSASADDVLSRLMASGLLRDAELMAEVIARVRTETIGAALTVHGAQDPHRPDLISRLVQHPDRLVASSAMGILIAESRRVSGAERPQLAHADLPARLHRRITWWVAAALRERARITAGRTARALDTALGDAVARSLAAYDEGERLETAAMRLAAVLAPPAGDLADLLGEALEDRRLVLFIALLAHGLDLDYALSRDIVLDPAGERLWLALRALHLGRDPIARIGHALCVADPRRNLEAFLDLLDPIASIPADQARSALAPLWLDPDYRAAMAALARAGRVA